MACRSPLAILLLWALALLSPCAMAQNGDPGGSDSYGGWIHPAGQITVLAPTSGSVGQVPVVPGDELPPAGKMVFISAPALAFQTAAAKAEREVVEAQLALAEARRALIRWEVEQGKAKVTAGAKAEQGAEQGTVPPATGKTDPAQPTQQQPPKPDPAAEGGLLRIAAADREVVIARAQVRLAQTRVLAAEAAQEQAWIRSPLPKARILQVHARKGQTVVAGVTPLVQLAHAGHVEVHFQIPPKGWASGRFTPGAALLVRVQPFPGEASRPRDLKGSLLHVEPRLVDGFLPAVLRLNIPKQGPALLPGRRVDVRLPPTSSEDR